MSNSEDPIGRLIGPECFFSNRVTRRTLEHLIRLGLNVNPSRPQGCTLIGPSLIGKTFLLKRAMKIFMDEFSESDPKPHPIVYISAPIEGKRREMWQALARVIGIPFDGRTNWTALRDRVKDGLVTAGTRVLFIDELNNIITGQFKQQLATLDDIRVLSNDLRFPIIAAGTSQALTALKQNEQNYSRFPAIQIQFLSPDKDFIEMLMGFEVEMQVHKGTFSSEVPATRLFELSLRKMGRLCWLLNESLLEARREGSTHIALRHIESASLNDLPWIPMNEFRKGQA